MVLDNSIVINDIQRSLLSISHNDSSKSIPIANIKKLYHNTGRHSDANNIIIGVIAGSAIGGLVGGLLASGEKMGGGKPYLIGGIVAGGVIGFLATYEDEKEEYILEGLPWEDRIEILNSIISSKYAPNNAL